MLARRLWLAAISILLLAVIAGGAVVVFGHQSKPQSEASIEKLTVEEDLSGPVMHGLFDRFGQAVASSETCDGSSSSNWVSVRSAGSAAPLHGGCSSAVTCPLGSHSTINTGCIEFSVSKSQICNINPSCNGSYCEGTARVSCCGEPCIQDAPPQCAGCQRTGSCH